MEEAHAFKERKYLDLAKELKKKDGYEAKAQVSDSEFIHLRIFKSLQMEAQFVEQQLGKSREDALEYF
ncbi:cystatin-b [Plakobranchus ocellatus]|uniref:Cystatin-b n=1 Tax=Plakobranchus ocellatus TaxID=259542 RepID=A0AAV3ZY17_9GAST|nr:cystatin-b [Plakobranchus ocellatus]